MTESKLAQILYRVGKMLVALLEKEYGCGKGREHDAN